MRSEKEIDQRIRKLQGYALNTAREAQQLLRELDPADGQAMRRMRSPLEFVQKFQQAYETSLRVAELMQTLHEG